MTPSTAGCGSDVTVDRPPTSEIDWRALSDDGRRALRAALLVAAGYTHGETARMLGISRNQVDKMMLGLRQELREGAGG